MSLVGNVEPKTSGITHHDADLEVYLDGLQDTVDVLRDDVSDWANLPSTMKQQYFEPLVGGKNPQGLGESEDYYFITYDAGANGFVRRINKTTGLFTDSPSITSAHSQGILVRDNNVVLLSYANAQLVQYNFSTGAISYFALAGTTNLPTGFKAGQPFCWDGTDLVYQLDVEGDTGSPTGEYDQVRVYSLGLGAHTAVLPLDRCMVKEGTVQGITYNRGMLYLYTGGSYSGTNDSNQNITSVYVITTGGVVLNSRQYYAATFAAQFRDPSIVYTYYEAQGIVVSGKDVVLMFYAGTRLVIAKADPTGTLIFQGVNSTSYIVYQQYTRVQDLRLSPSNLAASSDVLGSISNSMLNKSELFVALDSSLYPAITTAVGITSGNLMVRKYNPFRTHVQIQGLDSTGTPCLGLCWVNSGVSTPIKWVQKGLKTLVPKYDNGTVASIGPVVLSGISSCDTCVLHITHTSSSNPVTPFTFSRAEIDWYIQNSTVLYLGDSVGFMTVQFTSTGVNITGVTGGVMLRRAIMG